MLIEFTLLQLLVYCLIGNGTIPVSLIGNKHNFLPAVRKDIKFIVNDILLHLSSMEGMFIGVNKHGKNTDSTHVKIDSLFSSNQVVCIFPAGMVSRKIDGKIQDYAWKKTFLSQSTRQNLQT